MENIFYEGKFYSDISELIDDLELEETINDEPDDWTIICKESNLQKIITLSEDWINDKINDERLPEDEDRVFDKLSKALKTIDYDKVNALMPELYYESRRKFVITKKDILDYLA
ncbi:MAG: hypothetical protein ABIP51_13535 [Bacteroidia bacterium]